MDTADSRSSEFSDQEMEENRRGLRQRYREVNERLEGDYTAYRSYLRVNSQCTFFNRKPSQAHRSRP